MCTEFPSKIADFLLEGEYFSKKQEGSSASAASNCFLKVDEDGFFLIWCFSNQNEINTLECNHIKEVAVGIPWKDLKLLPVAGNGDCDLSSRVLTIYHGFEIGSLSVLQFLCASSAQAEKWKIELNRIVYRLYSRFLSPISVLRKQWKRLFYSRTPRDTIPVRKLFKHFGHDKNEKTVLQKLKSCGFSYAKNDEINPNAFTFDTYKAIHKKMCTRPDLDDLFVQIAGKAANHIELSQLVKWLNDHQRDPRLNEILAPPFDEKRTRSIIAKYESCPKNCEADRLSKQGFFDYLASDDNCMIYRDHISVCHDMDQPLNHYFINSSHNTYLTGFQWRGKSSVDIYRHALLAGYRCIELDCWDGLGKYHGEPIITHGKAMCTDVVFKDVLYAIRDAAFVTSDYPLILSFETHCSKPLQLKMAKYCQEVFGGLLLEQSMDSHPLEPGIPLPSPNSLKRKILIKNKRLDPEVERAQLENLSRNKDFVLDDEPEEAHPELDEVKTEDTADDANGVKTGTDVTVEENSKPPDSTPDQPPLKSRSSFKKTNAFPDDDEMEIAYYEYTKTSATNIHPYLSALVNYCQSVKFPGFKKVEEDNNQKLCFQMSSFSESVGLNNLKSNAIDFVNYNRSQLSRIYPKGSRFDSSNYMPQIFWNAGCQMVSLNVQTYDLGIQLNSEKFAYNGRSGYLLKPDVLLKGSKNFDPFSESTVDGVIAAQCGVKIISAQYISDRPVSSSVDVEMYGLPTDTIRKEFRTGTVPANGLNPIYNKDNNEFLFRKIICPDLALLRFTLYDENRQLIGQRVVPLGSLQTGYRYVPLQSGTGVPIDSATIFVKFSLRSYVPESLLDIASALENPKAHQTSLLMQHAQQLRCLEGDDAEEDDDIAMTKDSDREVVPANGSIRKEEEPSRNQKSKTSAKERGKEQLTSKTSNSSSKQGTLATKSDEKKAIEEVIEQSTVSMETLQSHPIFLKALEAYKKECTKKSKKLQRKSSAIEKRSNGESSTLCCGLSRMISGRRSNSNNSNSIQVDERSPLDQFNDPMSPGRRKKALIDALEAIHEDTREKLKKSQEKEMNELTQGQTKRWIENSKQVSKDKSIAPAERERRIRDLKSQDIKSFTEVRQTLKNRHVKQLERIDSILKEENERMLKEIESDVA